MGVQGNPNHNSAYMAATYFEYHGIEPGAYYGLEYRRVSQYLYCTLRPVSCFSSQFSFLVFESKVNEDSLFICLFHIRYSLQIRRSLICNFFLNVGPPQERIFLTTFYVLHFSHQYTNITNYISS